MLNYLFKMSETAFKAPRAFKKSPKSEDEDVYATSPKRPRTSEDFYLFCKYILEYEDYENQKVQDEMREKASSPIGSTGSGADSIKSESASSSQDDRKSSDDAGTSDDDSYDVITCYCSKPFAGRAMIECNECLTWIHLSCAKIKKSNIPEIFICVKCTNKQKQTSEESTHLSYRSKKRITV
ncbi:hypothetical protein FOCC_FOCC012178 [Frankliniella occidentalis]|nr:hypothetical protein FOCC_FOCC012178 [Frankliniella occidentalis]